MRRGLDLANATVNVTQLIAIIGAVIAATMAWDEVINRLDATEQRAIQLQSQIGETNERLYRLEAPQ